jgi:glycerol-3-phosphate dehydrogenase
MQPSTVALNRDHRAESLQRMTGETVDVLVIGGGVVGAGCAVDAVTRGLSVALVEQRDFASGTSSRSSKLIHGGLRYLEQYNFGLVREALAERALLLRTLAPHLVRPVPFLFPLRHRVWERAYVGAGVLLYDVLGLLGGHRAVPGHRHLSKRRALQIGPGLREDALVGAVQYYDAQVDDARHTMMLARTAAVYGAAVATSARVTNLLRENQQVVGATVHDLEADEQLTVRARHVINATGVWTDDINKMLGGHTNLEVRPSKGIHLVVPRDRIRLDSGMITRTEKSVLFVIPWSAGERRPGARGEHWLIGTTDTDYQLDRAHPASTQQDIQYVLDHVNEWVSDPLTVDDIEGVFAGLRPLISQDPTRSTAALSREHSLLQPVDGLTIIAGGKYTTYRVMAKDAVDAAARKLDGLASSSAAVGHSPVPESVSKEVPTIGAEGYQALRNSRQRLAMRSGLPADVIDHLLGRYGSLIVEVLALAAERADLGEPIPGADTYIKAEAVYAVRAEAALHLEDVLVRRTRISFEMADGGLEAAQTVADLMAGELGWNERVRARELDTYRSRVEAERAAHLEATEEAAGAARGRAPEIRSGAA